MRLLFLLRELLRRMTPGFAEDGAGGHSILSGIPAPAHLLKVIRTVTSDNHIKFRSATRILW